MWFQPSEAASIGCTRGPLTPRRVAWIGRPTATCSPFRGADGWKGAWISLLSVVDSTTRKLTSPSGEEVDYSPAFSPDGLTVAFVRGTRAGAVEDLYVVRTAGGVPTRLTFDRTWIKGSPT